MSALPRERRRGNRREARGPLTRATLCTLFLAALGCASYDERPDPYLDPWVGSSERELLDVWGFPDQRYPTANWELFVYRSQLPRTWRWINAGGLRCEVTFGLYRDEVSMTAWSGEGWICARLARARPPP